MEWRICLTAWSSIGGTVGERKGGVTLLEEICLGREDFGVSKDLLHSQPPLASSPCDCGSKYELLVTASAPSLLACHHILHHEDFWTHPVKL